MFNWLDRAQPLGLLLMRVVLGAIMTAHGYSKVFGGLSKHAAFVHSLGVPAWLGYVSAFVEFGGGILLIVGFATRFAAFAVLINLLVAIFKVHLHNGLKGPGGYEFPLACATLAFALIFYGSGPISADWLFDPSSTKRK